MMVANVQRVGGKLVLELDEALVERLKLAAGDALQVTPSGDGFLVLPVDNAERRQRFQAALDDTNRRYGGMLKRLAE